MVRHVGAGALTFALLGVMACLLYIAFNKSLDMESAPKENDAWDIRLALGNQNSGMPRFGHKIERD